MIQKDAGVLQMESFSSGREEFLALELEEEADAQLSRLSSVSGNSFEKLLAAVMLKEQFRPGKQIRKGEAVADMLGYERINEAAFSSVASFYGRMFGCVEFLPVASVYAMQEGDRMQEGEILYDAQTRVNHAAQTTSENGKTGANTKNEGYWVQIPVEEAWQGIVPVVCMKSGTVMEEEGAQTVENTLGMELEDGIRILYGNMADFLKDWQPGDTIESGEILGSAAELEIQFQLQIEDGSWRSFNGLPCLKHGKKQIRSVTQTFQTEASMRMSRITLRPVKESSFSAR